MSTARRVRRILLVLLAVLVLVVAVGGIVVGVTIRRSFPQLDGQLAVPGLGHRVTVLRDEWGVPQIYASDARDLFRAQGYVHAQDRFFEMDFRRHVTAGRLSEMFGKDQVETDAFIRTLGWRRVAEQELALLDPTTLEYLSAYAEGVNAWLAGHSGADASLEYAVLGLRTDYTPERWTPADSVAWLKAMAWDLRGNMTEEIQRAVLDARLPAARVAELYPPYPYDQHRPIVAGGQVTDGKFVAGASGGTQQAARPLPPAALARLDDVRALVEHVPALLGPTGTGLGSNAWAVSGARSATGKPLLANDPHLGPSMPSIWEQMGLHCTSRGPACPFDVAGFTFSGLPGVVIGHNDRIAWGFTNLGPDVTDLYLEKVDGATYQYDGRSVPLQRRTEVIQVAGGKPVTITVRSTRHGPLVSDVSDQLAQVGQKAVAPTGSPPRGTGYAVALRWTALTPGRTADAIFLLDAARDWQAFRTAASSFDVPSQNLVYADRDGHIGYQAPGKIPIRKTGNGDTPALGWDPAYEWTGYVPFDALPSVLDPAEGYVVTANQAVVGPSYPYHLTDDWDYGYRSQRIVERVTAKPRLDVAAMAAIQMDTRNPMAQTLVPYLLKVKVDGFTDEARRLLKGWDYRQPADSAPAAYYNAVWRNLLRLTFQDEMPEDEWPDGGDRWFMVVSDLLRSPSDPWWDDVRTKDRRETRDDVLAKALTDARAELTKRLGKDPADWQWGRLHRLELVNASLGTSGIGPVEWLFNRGPVQLGGGTAIVDATGWTAPAGYAVDWVPSMRMVVDLADLDRSRWVDLTGVSGHAFAPHYWDQTELWATGRTTSWRFSQAAVSDAAKHRLTLVPGPTSSG